MRMRLNLLNTSKVLGLYFQRGKFSFVFIDISLDDYKFDNTN